MRIIQIAAALCAAVSALSFANQTYAGTVVEWHKDNLTGFSLSYTGTLAVDQFGGGHSAGGTFESPSGLWTVSYSGSMFSTYDSGLLATEDGAISNGTFHGFHGFRFFTSGFNDYVYRLPYSSGDGYQIYEDGVIDTWGGFHRIQILSGEPDDLSTWAYRITIELETPPQLVPDSASTIVLLGALGLVIFVRARANAGGVGPSLPPFAD